MVGEYTTAPLESLCELIVDCPHSTPVWTSSGVIVLRNQNIRDGRLDLSNPSYTDEAHYQDRIRRAEPSEGDLVITREAPMGEVCQIPASVRCCLGQRMVLLRPNNAQTDGRFLLFALQSRPVKEQIGWAEGTGSTVSNLRIPDLKKLQIPCPVLAEQRAIAHILGTLDDKIELNRRMNETLEAIARALFTSWFVDFDPVRAKVEGRDPGLPNEIAGLFPSRLVDSALGEIPEGWEVAPVSKLIDFNPNEPLRKGELAPYLDMASLPTAGSWPEAPIIRPFGSGMRFRNGDTLLARITPCLENGKAAFVQCLPDGVVGWGSTEYIVMRPKPPVPPEFAYLLARYPAFREQAIKSMTGTSGRQRVQGESVAAFKLAVPANKKLWHIFAALVSPAFQSIKSYSETSATLSLLRDTLLPKLISGKLLVGGTERILGSTT